MKSKTFRRLTAIVLAVMLTLSMCITGMSAMAAEKTKTITVGVINYICNDKTVDLSKAQVHYWDSSTNSDADCVALNTTAKKSVGASYWSGAEQTFNMYTAEIPESATGFKFHIGDRWFGADGDAAKYNAVYAFNYSGDKALYDTIAVEPDPTTATESTEATEVTEATEATEATTPVTGDIVKFTDNHGWGENGGKIYAYFFSEDELDLAGKWPGTAMGNPEDNGMGQKNYSAAIPEGATTVIFTNGTDQTEDITLGGFEGYYTTDERDSEGHLIATGWNTTPAPTTATEGSTTATEATDASVETTAPATVEYYLVGNINGKDYGFEGDYLNKGDYKFVNGKVTVEFTEKSYVIVKTGDNANWYMTDGWLGETVTEATLYESKVLGDKCNKLCVPAGKVTFTLTPGTETNTFVLSYVVEEVATSATDSTTETTPITGDVVKFTDNHGWGENGGKIYAYFFSEDEIDLAGKWPGTAMGNPEDNGMGQKNYSVAIPEGATTVIFTNGTDQTEDITLGGFEGYYTTDERDSEGHLLAFGWNTTPAPTTATEATEATEATTPVTGDIVKFTDNHGWGENGGKIYAYFFSKDEIDLAGKWPGTAMGNPEDNGMGQKNYSVAIPEGATAVIFTNGTDQTEDITLGGFEGYYTTDERDSEGHLLAFGWNSEVEPTTEVVPTTEEPTEEPTTNPVVDKATIYFAAPQGSQSKYTWNNVQLYYGESATMTKNNFIDMTATGKVATVDAGSLTSVVSGDWAVYSVTLTAEQIAAIDSASRVGFANADNYNIRTDFRLANNVTGDASIAAYDGKMFVIDGCAGSTEVNSYTGKWTDDTGHDPVVSKTATIYFAAPQGSQSKYTWNNVQLYYGESATMTKNNFIDMTATGKVATVDAGSLTSVVSGDWAVYSVTLTAEQVAAIDSASRVGFANADNYNIRTDFRLANNVTGDASIAAYDGKMFVIDGCAGTTEVNSYTGKWTDDTGHDPIVSKTATIYFAAPQGSQSKYTWNNVQLYYGESATMTKNNFIDMTATSKVATVDAGSLTSVVSGDWVVYSVTLTAEQIAAIDSASRVGFANADNYNIRTDFRLANNITGDASIAAYDGKMFVIDGCAGSTEVNSYTGKWTDDTGHEVSKTATIYFAAPQGSQSKYTWNNVQLYYGESATMTKNNFIDMTATGEVATVDAGSLKSVVSGDWAVYSVTLTAEQIAAIDSASRVGFANADNYNIRTDYRYANNVAGDASIAAYDGKMFIIEGCAGSTEVNSYIGSWK